ncbi:FtsQ-type POTRA domain-containing protein [Candidatus Microgenomates bacterium]|nr:FtsQ-type POTRA domain-containing protein [Candidatus Microgenomates bacterium]
MPRQKRVEQYYQTEKKKKFSFSFRSPIAEAKNLPGQYANAIFGRPYRLIRVSYLYIGISLILTLIIIYFVLFSSIFQIKKITVSGNQVLLEDDVVSFLKDRNIEKKNIFLLNSSQLKGILKDYYRRIEDVRVYRVLPSKIKIKISEKPSAIIWRTGESRYLLDMNGFVLGQPEEGTPMPEVTDLAALPVGDGARVVTRTFIDFVNTVDESLKKRFGLGVVGYSINQTTFELKTHINSGFYLLFDTLADPSEQLEKLTKVYEKGEIINEYVILSIEGKVIVK